MNKVTLLFIALVSVHFNNAMNDGSMEYHNFPIKRTVSGSIIKYDFWNKQNQPTSVEYNTETERYFSESVIPAGQYGQSITVIYRNQDELKKLFEDIESAYKSEQKLKQE